MKFKGIAPIVAVPFKADGEVDYEGFRRICKYLSGTSIEAAFLFGIASEFPKISDVEKFALAKIFINEIKSINNVQAFISVTDHSAEVAQVNSIKFEEMGADGLMIFPPHFLSPGPNSIIEHIDIICKSVKLPIMVQYAPAQSGIRLEPIIFSKLQKDNPNFNYLKIETQPPGKYLTSVLEHNIDVDCFVGYAGIQMPDFLARGGKGIQPGCSFIEIYEELWDLWTKNEMSDFNEIFNRLAKYTSYWMQNVELIIQVEKYILMKRGIIDNDYCRRPNYQLDKREYQFVDEFLEEFKEILGGIYENNRY